MNIQTFTMNKNGRFIAQIVTVEEILEVASQPLKEDMDEAQAQAIFFGSLLKSENSSVR